MLAGIASGTATQGVIAQSRKGRLRHILIFSSLYFIVFSLGLLVRDSQILTAIVLVGLGFFANYIRRFGFEKSIAPLLVWVLCFLATILPFDSTRQAWLHIDGLIVGLGVSGFITLFIFPENYANLFISNTNRFLHDLSDGMNSLRRYLLLTKEKESGIFKEKAFVQLKFSLMHLADSNQAIGNDPSFSQEEAQISQVLVAQYGLINAYALLVDAAHDLWEREIEFPRAVELKLALVCKHFSKLFSNIETQQNFQVTKNTHLSIALSHNEKIDHAPIGDSEAILQLLNFKLGFDLLVQHASHLVWSEANA